MNTSRSNRSFWKHLARILAPPVCTGLLWLGMPVTASAQEAFGEVSLVFLQPVDIMEDGPYPLAGQPKSYRLVVVDKAGHELKGEAYKKFIREIQQDGSVRGINPLNMDVVGQQPALSDNGVVTVFPGADAGTARVEIRNPHYPDNPNFVARHLVVNHGGAGAGAGPGAGNGGGGMMQPPQNIKPAPQNQPGAGGADPCLVSLGILGAVGAAVLAAMAIGGLPGLGGGGCPGDLWGCPGYGQGHCCPGDHPYYARDGNCYASIFDMPPGVSGVLCSPGLK